MRQLAVICLFLCGSGELSAPVWGDEKPKEEKVFTATVDSNGVQRVEILGGSYFFTPNRVIVKVNVPVELKVKKEAGIVPHTIAIKAPEAGIDFEITLKDDETQTIRFTPTKVGRFEIYCSKKLWPFKSHREKGMEGTLEVTE